MHRQAPLACGGHVLGRDRGADEPPEDVPDAALPGLIAPQPGDDAAVDDATHARHLVQRISIHHVARRGTHDGDHLAGLDGVRRGGGDVRVDVADGDCDPDGQSGPRRGLRGQRAGDSAELADRVGQLGLDEVCEVRVEGREEVARRVLAVLQDPLVPSRARVAHVLTRQLPHDPVRSLDPVRGGVVDLAVLLEQLQALGELPLRGDQAAVARDPGFVALVGQCGDAVGVRLRRVVLPQLDVGVRPVREPRKLGERRPVGRGRDHGAGREVGSDPHDVRRVDPEVRVRGPDRSRDRGAQHVDVVGRDLQRPVRRERDRRAGRTGAQRALHDRVRVLVDRGTELRAVPHPHDDRPAGQGAIVHTHHERVARTHVPTSLNRHWDHSRSPPLAPRRQTSSASNDVSAHMASVKIAAAPCSRAPRGAAGWERSQARCPPWRRPRAACSGLPGSRSPGARWSAAG